MTVTIPADPRLAVLGWLRPFLAQVDGPLAGWAAGARVEAGETPVKFILVDVVDAPAVDRLAEDVLVRFQLFGTDGVTDDAERTLAARVLVAHIQRDLQARRVSGAVPLPDPTDPARSITQTTVSLLLRGEDQDG